MQLIASVSVYLSGRNKHQLTKVWQTLGFVMDHNELMFLIITKIMEFKDRSLLLVLQNRFELLLSLFVNSCGLEVATKK